MNFNPAENWPKHKSGIRKEFPRMPAAYPLIIKVNALYTLIRMRGSQLNDLWMQKVPNKRFSKLDKEIKIKNKFLEDNPKEFQNLKHPAGCSLQYLIMIADILGGPNWYEQYITRHDEADIIYQTQTNIENVLLKKFTKNEQRVSN